MMDGLGDRRVLLLLDTFEHLPGATPGVAGLLAACPGLTVLATSRETLHLRAERVMPVPPLALAPAGGSPTDVASSDSVRLFAERASAAQPGFRVTPANRAAVAAICARLDGLPLPIELAAAKVKTMSPTALEELLERTLVLKGGPRDAPARQQGLRSEIDWSYRLLDAAERTMFQRLGVFAGGCTVEAAAAVCRDAPTPEAIDVLDTLGSLVEKCLLQQHEEDGAPRYRMLQCIREFALEQLGDDGASGPVHDRFADWCLDLAERAAPNLYGAGQAAWLALLDGEYVNLRAALEWLAAQRDRLRGARLAGALGWFWLRRSDFTVAQRWLERFRSMAEDGDPPDPRALMTYSLGLTHTVLALKKFRNVAARDCFRESAALYRRSGDQPMLARALVMQADHEFDLSRDAVKAIVDEAILTARTGGDPWTRAFCLAFGTSAYGRAPPPEAEANLQEAIGGARATGDPWLYAETLACKAMFDRRREDFETAADLLPGSPRREPLDRQPDDDHRHGALPRRLQRGDEGCAEGTGAGARRRRVLHGFGRPRRARDAPRHPGRHRDDRGEDREGCPVDQRLGHHRGGAGIAQQLPGVERPGSPGLRRRGRDRQGHDPGAGRGVRHERRVNRPG